MTAIFGCASLVSRVAPYEASYENVRSLAAAPLKAVALDPFTSSGSGAMAFVRLEPAFSPVGENFADYVRDALEQELRRAHLLDPAAKTRISGDVVENRFHTLGATDASGERSQGHTIVEVEFVVRREGGERYRKIIRSDVGYPVTLLEGKHAISRALASYPDAVRGLLQRLYRDPAFLKALE
jgi:hypothetical protein